MLKHYLMRQRNKMRHCLKMCERYKMRKHLKMR